MTTTKQDLLNAILEDPADDMRRLVYADFLEENGERDRAEFIRVQIELVPYQDKKNWIEQMPVEQWAGSKEEGELLQRIAVLVQREKELFKQSPRTHEWLGSALRLTYAGQNWWEILRWFRRGFIGRVTCSSADWFKHHEDITSQHPIEEVRLTDMPRFGRHTSPTLWTVWLMDMEPKLQLPIYSFDMDLHKYRSLLKLHWPRITFHLPNCDNSEIISTSSQRNLLETYS